LYKYGGYLIVQTGADCFIVMIADSEENIVTAGAFDTRDDAETAIAMLRKIFADFEGKVQGRYPLKKSCEFLGLQSLGITMQNFCRPTSAVKTEFLSRLDG